MTRKEIAVISGIFLIWRIALFVLALIATKVLPYAPSFPYATTLLPSFGLPQWVYSFANFDGVHYLTIAREGYLSANYIQAFFPFFPFVILHSLHLLIPSLNVMSIGLLIANMSFLGFLLLSFDFIERKYSKRIAWRFILAVLLFPWSVFFASLYTESLFLLLVIICFRMADKKRWFVAAVATAVLSSTRVVGVVMVPALWIELWRQGERDWKKYALISLGSLGLMAYMAYLQLHFSDPLLFLHVQSAFGSGRTNGITLYPQVMYRSLKILLSATRDLKYVTYSEEFIVGTIGVAAIIIPFKKIPLGITFFALCSVIIPTVSGSFSSLGRYLLPALPVYLLIAFFASRHPRLGIVWYGLSTIVFIVNTILFLQGYWVA